MKQLRSSPLRISVIGCGYLGTTHAASLAHLGFEVVGVDTDPRKVQLLSEGSSPIHEPGLEELLGQGAASGRLRFTSAIDEVAEWADVHFICVGTPQRSTDGGADVSQIEDAINSLAPLLVRPSVLVGKSTVPVGTARRLREAVRSAAPAGSDVDLAWNPEFLREGLAVEDTLHPDRLVFGVADGDSRSVHVLRHVYANAIEAGCRVIECDLATAEMVKVAANGFLATKISYINAIGEMCEAAGADVRVLADAIGLDARIGRSFLNAGVGFGGGCLPKDIRALAVRAGELGVADAAGILREVDQINLRQRERVLQKAASLLAGHVKGSRISVLGAAFKPNSDDVRDSPALDVAGRLQLAGAHVVVYDPEATANARAVRPTLRFASSAVEASQDADLTIVLTEWEEFRQLDPEKLGRVVNAPRVLDARNCLPAHSWVKAGWIYRGMGVPSSD